MEVTLKGQTSVIRKRISPNLASSITKGGYKQKQKRAYSYGDPVTIDIKGEWSSPATRQLLYQVRAKTTQGDSYILQAPRPVSQISLRVPFTNNLYIDVLDDQGNYATTFISNRVNIKSPRTIKYANFKSSVEALINQVTHVFDEITFEDQIYNLKMDTEALYYGIVTPYDSREEFDALCENILSYLHT